MTRCLTWIISFLFLGSFDNLSITSLTEVRTIRISSTAARAARAELGASATLEMKPEMMMQMFPATLSRPVTEAAMLKGSAIAMFGTEISGFHGGTKKEGVKRRRRGCVRLGKAY